MLGRKDGLTKVTDTYLETHDFKVLACEKSKIILSPAECQGKLNERNLRGLVRSIAQFGPGAALHASFSDTLSWLCSAITGVTR
jgi:hypothetical protein